MTKSYACRGLPGRTHAPMKTAAAAYRQLRNLAPDWEPDWSSQEWNWFRIGWDACGLAMHERLAKEEPRGNGPTRSDMRGDAA